MATRKAPGREPPAAALDTADDLFKRVAQLRESALEIYRKSDELHRRAEDAHDRAGRLHQAAIEHRQSNKKVVARRQANKKSGAQ